MPAVKNTDTTVEGFHQPMRVAGLVYGNLDELQWGRAEQAADYFDVKGEVEALLAPIQATFEPAQHPTHAPRPLRPRVGQWSRDWLHRRNAS